MTTETTDRRTILRYRGEPVTHRLRFYGGGQTQAASYRQLPLVAECDAGDFTVRIDGGHTIADLARLERQHAGLEDDDP